MRRVKGKNSPTSYFRCSTLRVARVPHNIDVPRGLAATPGVGRDWEQEPLHCRVDEVVVEDQLRVLVVLGARVRFVLCIAVPLVRARAKVLVVVELALQSTSRLMNTFAPSNSAVYVDTPRFTRCATIFVIA